MDAASLVATNAFSPFAISRSTADATFLSVVLVVAPVVPVLVPIVVLVVAKDRRWIGCRPYPIEDIREIVADRPR